MKVELEYRQEVKDSGLLDELVKELPVIVADSFNRLADPDAQCHRSSVRVWAKPFLSEVASGHGFQILLITELTPHRLQILGRWRTRIAEKVREVLHIHALNHGGGARSLGFLQIVLGEETHEVI